MKRGWLECAARSPLDFLHVLTESAYRPHLRDERETPALFGKQASR
jgi:hypothetical protein